MPYPTDTLKIVFGGAAGSDIWRTSFDMELVLAVGTWGLSDMTTVVTDIEGHVGAFWGGDLKTFNTLAVTYAFCKGYFYPEGTTQAQQVVEVPVTAVVGTGATNVHAFRSCLVLSKLTNLAGRRNKGRMYLPFTAGALTAATGQTNQAGIAALVADAKTMFDDINASDYTAEDVTTHFITVTSPTRTADPTAVTAVRMDSLPDTQRRRTNKAVASFTEIDFLA